MAKNTVAGIKQIAKRALPRTAGLADQALFSAASLIQTAVYARLLPASAFGYFALTVSICVVAQSIQRALIIIPLILSQSSENQDNVQRWMIASHILTALIMATFAMASLILYFIVSKNELLHFLILTTLAIGPYITYEFSRRCFFVLGRHREAILASSAFFSFQITAIVFVWLVGANYVTAVAAQAVGMLAATLIGFYLLRPYISKKPLQLRELVKSYRQVMGWNLAALGPYTIYNNGMPLIVASAGGGATSAAIFSATRIFLAPISMLISAIDSVDKPRASRALNSGGLPALRGSILKTAMTLTLLGLPYLVILGLFPQTFLNLLLGASYVEHVGTAQLWLVAGLLMLAGQPMEVGLEILRKSHLYFWSRLVAAAAALALFFFSPRDAAAAVVAVAAAWGTSGTMALIILIRALSPIKRSSTCND